MCCCSNTGVEWIAKELVQKVDSGDDFPLAPGGDRRLCFNNLPDVSTIYLMFQQSTWCWTLGSEGPQRWQGMSDVSHLSGISGLSFASPFPVFFCSSVLFSPVALSVLPLSATQLIHSPDFSIALTQPYWLTGPKTPTYLLLLLEKSPESLVKRQTCVVMTRVQQIDW